MRLQLATLVEEYAFKSTRITVFKIPQFLLTVLSSCIIEEVQLPDLGREFTRILAEKNGLDVWRFSYLSACISAKHMEKT